MKLLTNAPAGSPEWKAARRGKITASGAANIVAGGIPGVPTYASPLEEFVRLKAELSGEFDEDEPDEDALPHVTDDEVKASEEMQWGLDSEELHLKILKRETGWSVVADHAVVQDDEFDWLACALDAMRNDEGARGPIELKAPTWFKLGKWKEAAPFAYQVQNAVQARIVGASWGCVSALMAPRVVYYENVIDQATADYVMSKLIAFWEALQRDIPPEAQATDGDLNALRELARPKAGKVAYFTSAADQAHAKLVQAKADIKAAEAAETAAKLVLMNELLAADADLGIFRDGTGYTFRATDRPIPAKAAYVQHVKPSLRFTKNAL